MIIFLLFSSNTNIVFSHQNCTWGERLPPPRPFPYFSDPVIYQIWLGVHDDDDSHTSPTLEMVFNLEAASVGSQSLKYSFVWVEKQPVDGATSVFLVKVHLAPVVSSYTVNNGFFFSNCRVTQLLLQLRKWCGFSNYCFHIFKNITILNCIEWYVAFLSCEFACVYSYCSS